MIVLASTSKYRAELLSRLAKPFQCTPPICDETPLPNEQPEPLAARLALTKAQSLIAEHPNSLIIGSDQVACVGNEILGKPGTAANACAQLSRMQGRCVDFFTAVCVINTATSEQHEFVDKTVATLRQLSDDEISRYVGVDTPLDCAGSFKVESLGVSLFDSIETTDPTALVGLPLIQLCKCLRDCGVAVP